MRKTSFISRFNGLKCFTILINQHHNLHSNFYLMFELQQELLYVKNAN